MLEKYSWLSIKIINAPWTGFLKELKSVVPVKITRLLKLIFVVWDNLFFDHLAGFTKTYLNGILPDFADLNYTNHIARLDEMSRSVDSQKADHPIGVGLTNKAGIFDRGPWAFFRQRSVFFRGGSMVLRVRNGSRFLFDKSIQKRIAVIE